MPSSAAQDGAEREDGLLATSAGMPPERHSGGQELLFSCPARIHQTGAHEDGAVGTESEEGHGARPDPDRIRSSALRGVWQSSAALAAVLALLAWNAPSWTGDPRAAILPGAPGAVMGLLFVLGARPARRRAAMVLATTTAGFLALATVASVGSISLLGTERGSAVAFQLACLATSAAFLARSAPAWRRVNADGDQAEQLLRMYDEL